MSSLYETALNGMGLGTNIDDINRLIKDHEGQTLKYAILISIGMGLDDLKRAEGRAQRSAKILRSYLASFEANPTVSNAEWLAKYARETEDYTRQAQAAYQAVGAAFRLWALAG